MISLEKWKILTPLQNLPRNVGDLGELIVSKGFKKLPKVQKIAKSVHSPSTTNFLLTKCVTKAYWPIPCWPNVGVHEMGYALLY